MKRWWLAFVVIGVVGVAGTNMLAKRATAGAGGQSLEERLRTLEDEQVRAARERATVLVMLHEWERHGTAVDRQLLANQRAMLMDQHRTQQALARMEGRRR